jgi:hypothetical protein
MKAGRERFRNAAGRSCARQQPIPGDAMNIAEKLEKLDKPQQAPIAPKFAPRSAGEVEYDSWSLPPAGELEYQSWFPRR